MLLAPALWHNIEMIKGGCFRGRVRYELRGTPFDAVPAARGAP